MKSGNEADSMAAVNGWTVGCWKLEIDVADAVKKTRWTYDDYESFPEDKVKREILRGELFATPPADEIHHRVQANLQFAIMSYAKSHGGGRCFASSIAVIVSNDTVVEPDVVYVGPSRLGIIERRGIRGAPDLVVEVLSPSTRKQDLGSKRETYATMGVKEYWIVDPKDRHVDVWVHDGKDLLKRAEIRAGVVESLAALVGFSIPLAAIFE
ncbi:MAG: Uma2 family endonuclease [Planctomycetes bacterium]|nr:Uma2 family endonuclease [Planctomycetota bacterium]MBI3847609.1 Uma2 family endonuclease [Planctomycetota bacterium]